MNREKLETHPCDMLEASTAEALYAALDLYNRLGMESWHALREGVSGFTRDDLARIFVLHIDNHRSLIEFMQEEAEKERQREREGADE